MKLDYNLLKTTCFEIAKSTMYDLRPVNVSSIDDVATRFFKIVVKHEEYIISNGRDPNMLIRAVQYLNHHHAIPPMKDDTKWFEDMLEALIELVCPNTETNLKEDAFLHDIEEGISARYK